MDQLKRYLVFGYKEYYPGGGVTDQVATCDTIEEVRNLRNTVAKRDLKEFVDVLDMQERRWLADHEHGLLKKPEVTSIRMRGGIDIPAE
nr:hypothetical protein [uncultured Arsenicibacter sp.]